MQSQPSNLKHRKPALKVSGRRYMCAENHFHEPITVFHRLELTQHPDLHLHLTLTCHSYKHPGNTCIEQSNSRQRRNPKKPASSSMLDLSFVQCCVRCTNCSGTIKKLYTPAVNDRVATRQHRRAVQMLPVMSWTRTTEPQSTQWN